MADNDIKLIIEAVLKDKEFKASVKSVVDGLQQANKEQQKLSQTAGSMFKQLKLGYLAVAGAIAGVIKVFASSVKGYIEQEKADRRLASSLRATGDESKTTLKALKSFASEMQKLTGISDDTIQNVTSLGLSMGISTGKIKEAVKGAIGLSQAFGLDLESSMKMVALANKGQYDMLGRYIPQLRVASSESEKAAIVQRVLADGFMSAKNEMGGDVQTLQKFSTTLGDFLEIIGKGVLTAISPLIRGITSIVLGFNEWVSPSEDMVSVTKSLIEEQTEYAKVVKRLANEQGTLSDAEERSLEVRKTQLQLSWNEKIDKISKAYNKYNTSLWDGTGELKRQQTAAVGLQRAYEDITNAIKNKTRADGLVAVTAREYALIMGGQATSLDAAGLAYIKLETAQKAQLRVSQELDNANANLAVSQEEYNGFMSELAWGVQQGIVKIDLLRIKNKALADEIERFKPVKKTPFAPESPIATSIEETESNERKGWEARRDRAKKQAEELGRINTDARNKIMEESKRQTIESAKLAQEERDKKIAAIQEYTTIGVDAITSMFGEEKKSAKEAAKDMIRSFVNLIAGKLSLQASEKFAEGFVNPAAFGQAAALTAGAVAVKAGGEAILGSFAKGTEELPSDGLIRAHKGERIIPTRMNVPGISNEDFINATLRGMMIPAMATAGGGTTDARTYNNQTVNQNNSLSFPFANPADILDLQARTGSRVFRR